MHQAKGGGGGGDGPGFRGGPARHGQRIGDYGHLVWRPRGPRPQHPHGAWSATGTSQRRFEGGGRRRALQLLHEGHDVEHELAGQHFVLVAEAAPQHPRHPALARGATRGGVGGAKHEARHGHVVAAHAGRVHFVDGLDPRPPRARRLPRRRGRAHRLHAHRQGLGVGHQRRDPSQDSARPADFRLIGGGLTKGENWSKVRLCIGMMTLMGFVGRSQKQKNNNKKVEQDDRWRQTKGGTNLLEASERGNGHGADEVVVQESAPGRDIFGATRVELQHGHNHPLPYAVLLSLQSGLVS